MYNYLYTFFRGNFMVESILRALIFTAVLTSLFLSGSGIVYAQGTLQFSQVKIVSGSLETVPAGKIWKVTSVSGEELRNNECVSMCAASTHELRRLRCAEQSESSKQFYYTISSVVVNSVVMPFRISGLLDKTLAGTYSSSCDCTGTPSVSSSVRTYSCANLSSDPNLLPMWLPSGATFKTGGPNTFATVLEFNVIP